MPEPDPPVDAFLARSFRHIVSNRRTWREGGVAAPWTEAVAEGEHVGIGSHAREAEQVPGAADGLPAFQDDVAEAGAQRLQVVAGGDAGQAGADDDHVEERVGLGLAWRRRGHAVA